MTKTRFFMAALCCLLFVSGCAPFRHSLQEGDSLPDGEVLLVGAVALDPPIEQGNMVHHDAMGASKGVMRVHLAKDLSQKVDVNSLMSLSIDDVLLMKLKGLSFISLKPGIRYVRLGIVDISSQGAIPVAPAGPGGAPGFRGIDVQSLYLVRDLKLDIPEKAKAVYIGTIVFKHDGQYATGVRVRDDFKQVAKEIAAKKITGITSQNLVKKLAQVVK